MLCERSLTGVGWAREWGTFLLHLESEYMPGHMRLGIAWTMQGWESEVERQNHAWHIY